MTGPRPVIDRLRPYDSDHDGRSFNREAGSRRVFPYGRLLERAYEGPSASQPGRFFILDACYGVGAHTDPPLGGRSDSLTLRVPGGVRQAECSAAQEVNQDFAHRIATECARPRSNRDIRRERNFTAFTFPANAPQTLPAYPIPRSPHWRRYEDRRRPPVVHQAPEASCAAPSRSSALEGRTATVG